MRENSEENLHVGMGLWQRSKEDWPGKLEPAIPQQMYVFLIPTVTKPVQAMFLSIPCWDNMYSVCYYMHWTSHKGSVTCLWAVAYYTFYLEILNYRIQKTSRAKRFLVFFQCSPTVVGLVYWVVNCFNYFIRSNKMSAGKGQSLNIQPQQTAAFGKIFTTVRRRW